MIDYLFDLLDFFEGRATNREVLDLMDSLPSRAKNEWEDADMEIFGNGSGTVMRIGGSVLSIVNDVDRPLLMSTPRHALDRMALGFCFRGHNRQLWEGTCPTMKLKASIPFVLPNFHAIRFGGLGKQVVVKDLSLLVELVTRLANEFFHQTDATLLDRRKINEAIESLASEYHQLAGEGKVLLGHSLSSWQCFGSRGTASAEVSFTQGDFQWIASNA